MTSEHKIQELEAKVEELTALVAQMTVERAAAPARSMTGADEPARSTRRNMLKLAGAAAVGAVAATATNALPAAADISNNTDTTLTVELNYTGTATAAAFVFQTGNQYNPAQASYPSAVAGWASSLGTANIPHGVYGYTDQPGYGLVGYGGNSNARGLLARGEKANVTMRPAGTAAPLRPGAFELGDMVEDSAGNLWLCVAGGASPSWRKLAGPVTAGSLHLLASPTRVYGTRPEDEPVAVGPKTPLSAGTRTIDCTANSSGVPSGATGLLLNVTAIASTANGFLAVSPGGVGFTGTSSLNWSAAGAIVANGVTVGAGVGATIDVTIGGGGTANFIVDVFGYYL